jgi:hypothetical protein
VAVQAAPFEEPLGVEQGPPPPAGEAGPHAELGRAHAPEAGMGAEGVWRRIQASFVDDPRGAVTSAGALVDELMERRIADLRADRAALDRYAGSGSEFSTEELRMRLQRFRGIFERLARL